ncbi:MAG: hypothetical protein MR591_05895 [Helicobacter sp.]|nr:hypothetical protein [Helicobacter sp.]
MISQKLVATIGVENLAIIDSGDCTLVAPLSQTQRIKEVVNILKTSHLELTQIHNTAHHNNGRKYTQSTTKCHSTIHHKHKL